MIKKILIATDGSKHAKKAVDHGCDIALKYDASVCLIHVISLPSMAYAEASFEPLRDQLKKAGKALIEEAEKRVKGKGVARVLAFLVEGEPAQEILRCAEKNNADMIIMGSRGTSGIGMVMLGSVSHKVCHLAEQTCVTVK
jgi:nucleotide-binding universal stress UspA family protein